MLLHDWIAEQPAQTVRGIAVSLYQVNLPLLLLKFFNFRLEKAISINSTPVKPDPEHC